VFLAICHHLGMSVQVGAQLTLLLAAFAVALCLWLLLRDPLVPTGAFVLLAFDPANFGTTSAYLMRDSWYASVCLLALFALFLTGYFAVRARRTAPIVLSAVLAGTATATAALCREESAWLAPAGLILVGALPATAAVRWLVKAPSRHPRRWPWRRLSLVAIAASVAALTLLAPMQAVVMANRHNYGVGLSNDMSAGQFPRAYADWTRVRAGRLLPQVPISQQQRMAVYAVSPAARELEPTMENPRNGFAGLSCGLAGIGPNCDISGAFTVWLMREAAARSGHFRTEVEAQRFFGQLDREIDTACRTKAITCVRRLPPALQPLQRVSLPDVFERSQRSGRTMLTNPGFTTLQPRAVSLTPRQRAQIRSVISGFPATDADAARQLGRFARHDWFYRLLAASYPPLLLGLLIVSLLGWVIALFRRRVLDAATVILGAGMVVALLSRAVILGVLDAAEYRAATNSRYQMPGRLCLIVFILVGVAVLVRFLRRNEPIWPHAVAARVSSDSAGLAIS
jgi:hypothetical protein